MNLYNIDLLLFAVDIAHTTSKKHDLFEAAELIYNPKFNIGLQID